MERSGSATARFCRHTVGAGAGFKEVLHYSKPPVCGV